MVLRLLGLGACCLFRSTENDKQTRMTKKKKQEEKKQNKKRKN